MPKSSHYKFCPQLYQFLTAAVTTCCKPGSLQPGQKSEISSTGLKSSGWQGHAPPEGSRRHFLALPLVIALFALFGSWPLSPSSKPEP